MSTLFQKSKAFLVLSVLLLCFTDIKAQSPKFHVIAFYTGRNDQAHISFMHEANRKFPELAKQYNFTYDSTSNWNNMNADFLSHYQVVIFLDTRPDDPAQTTPNAPDKSLPRAPPAGQAP